MEWRDIRELDRLGWIEESLNYNLNKNKSLTEKDVSEIERVLDQIDQLK